MSLWRAKHSSILPIQYDGNIYYASIKFEDGRVIQPTGQSEHRDEVQFRVSVPDAIDGQSTKGAWDPSNDWSYKGVGKTDLKSADSLNEHFTMYVNGNLVWGEEPDGTKAVPGADLEDKPIVQPGTTTKPKEDPVTTTTTTVTTTTEPVTSTTTLTTTSDDKPYGGDPANADWGNVNCSQGSTPEARVDVSDAVLLAKFLGSDSSAKITDQGKTNANVIKGDLDDNDLTAILKYIAKLIKYDQFPLEKLPN